MEDRSDLLYSLFPVRQIEGAEQVLDPAAAPPVPEEGATPANAEGATSENEIEIEGERVPIEQVQEWRDAHENRNKWQASLTQEAQANARMRGALEAAFQKPYRELNQNDIADLTAFGLLNHKLRSDPVFARAWQDSLAKTYQEYGASPQQAQRQAAADVRQAQQQTPQQSAQQPQGQRAAAPQQPQAIPQQPVLDPQLVAALQAQQQAVQAQQQRLAQMETITVRRELDNLANHLEGEIGSVLDQAAQDMPEFRDQMREGILHGLLGYDDGELLQMAYSGQLAEEVQGLAADQVKRVRAHVDRAMKAQAAAVQQRQQQAKATPMRSATVAAPVTPMPEAVRGKGLNAFSDRLRKALVGNE